MFLEDTEFLRISLAFWGGRTDLEVPESHLAGMDCEFLGLTLWRRWEVSRWNAGAPSRKRWDVTGPSPTACDLSAVGKGGDLWPTWWPTKIVEGAVRPGTGCLWSGLFPGSTAGQGLRDKAALATLSFHLQGTIPTWQQRTRLAQHTTCVGGEHGCKCWWLEVGRGKWRKKGSQGT